MIHKLVQYIVKKDTQDKVEEIVKEVVAEVKANEPNTLLYEVFQLSGTDSFIHIMTFKDTAAEEYHKKSKHITDFVKKLYPLCLATPIFTKLEKIEK
jgi:quinol monooxygenase YgiN